MKEVAALLSVSETKILEWIEQEQMPVFVSQGQYRFNRTELLEWATLRNLSVALGTHSENDIGACVEKGGIIRDVPGADFDSVMENVISKMNLPEGTDRQFLKEMILSHGAGSTICVGEGIAIPHPRSPAVLDLKDPQIWIAIPQ
jgi:PTS system nitrogen regulatory IIA component